jgi:hypothetical protein
MWFAPAGAERAPDEVDGKVLAQELGSFRQRQQRVAAEKGQLGLQRVDLRRAAGGSWSAAQHAEDLHCGPARRVAGDRAHGGQPGWCWCCQVRTQQQAHRPFHDGVDALNMLFAHLADQIELHHCCRR